MEGVAGLLIQGDYGLRKLEGYEDTKSLEASMTPEEYYWTRMEQTALFFKRLRNWFFDGNNEIRCHFYRLRK